MSVGKFTSLEEVRKNPELLKQFIKERIHDEQDVGDEDRFDVALENIVKGEQKKPK